MAKISHKQHQKTTDKLGDDISHVSQTKEEYS